MRIKRVRGLIAYSYLIETADSLYLMDAGFIGHGQRLLAEIDRIGRSPSEIRLAVISHGHIDHYGGLPALQEAADFDVLVHPSHGDRVADGTGAEISPGGPAWAKGYERLAKNSMQRMDLEPVRRVVYAHDGQRLDEWGLAGSLLFTPGHSTGDVSVVLDSGDAFVGDLVQGRRMPLLPPELPAMLCDAEQVLQSWEKVLDAGARHIWPAHGAPVSARVVRAAMPRLARAAKS